VTYPGTKDVGPVIPTVTAGPEGAVVAALGGDLDIAAVPAVRERLLGLLHTALPGTGPAVVTADVPAQAQAAPGTDSGELHAAVAAILASADAWRDADPRRRFSPALRALARADAGTSHAALVQAARSLLSVLSREPLTYSPAVAATAGRLRRLFPAGPRLALR
jgi:hypothetical protein